MTRRRAGSVAAHTALLLVAVVVLVPLVWLVLLSVSSINDLTTLPLRWIPRTLDLSRYGRLLSLAANSQGAMFLAALRNTLVWRWAPR